MQTTDASGKFVNPNDRRMAASLELNSTSNFAQEHLNVRKDGTIYGRINNRGCSNRTTYSSQDKWNNIEQFEMWFDDKKDTREPATVTSYISEHILATNYNNFLSTKIPGWRESNTKEAIRVAVTDQLKKKMDVPARSQKYVSDYRIMEQKFLLK